MKWWKGEVKYFKKKVRKITLALALFIFASGILSFNNGYHAIDLCRNEYDIEQGINAELKDLGINYSVSLSEMGGISDKSYNIANGECHIMGSNQMFLSLSLFVFLIILLLSHFAFLA